MRLYYSKENDKYYTENDIKKAFEELNKTDKERFNNNFEYFLNSCMVSNNGTLTTINEHENTLQRKLSKLTINEYLIDEALNYIYELKTLYEFKERYQ